MGEATVTFKSQTQPLCRYCGGHIAKHTTNVMVHEKQPKTTYEDDEVVQQDGKWVKTGKRITRNYAMGKFIVGAPETKEQAQTFVNEKVMSVRYDYETKDGERTGKKRISQLSVWDGETYVDQFFCTGDHAKLFGYSAANSGQVTPDYNAALLKQRESKNGA